MLLSPEPMVPTPIVPLDDARVERGTKVLDAPVNGVDIPGGKERVPGGLEKNLGGGEERNVLFGLPLAFPNILPPRANGPA